MNREVAEYIEMPGNIAREYVTESWPQDAGADDKETTYRLALESALRWLTLPAASHEARSQAVRWVITAALADA